MIFKLIILLIALISGIGTIPALIILICWQQEAQNEAIVRAINKRK